MHNPSIRGLNLILITDLKTTHQSFRIYLQHPFQFFSQGRGKSFVTNCRYQTTATNSSGKELPQYSGFQHYQNLKRQKNFFDGSLPNRNTFLQALRKQAEVDSEMSKNLERVSEKRKIRKPTDASKAFEKVNEALSPPNIFQLTSLQALDLYKNIHAHYHLKPFYLDLISYLLRRFADNDRLDLMEVVFAQFVRDVEVSERRYLIGGYMTKVWNTILCIYAERGYFDEVGVLFENMPRYTVIPDDATYKTLIRSTSKGKNIHLCFSYLGKSIIRGYKLDCNTLNSFLRACLMASTGSHRQKSIDIIINLMSLWKIGPNGESFKILIQHCKSFDDLDKLWAKIVDLGFHDNQTLQVEIVKKCLKLTFETRDGHHSWVAGDDCFSMIKELAKTREAGMSKCFDYLLRIFRKSQGEIVVGAYNNLLNACIQRGDIIRGMRVLEMMWSKNLEPSIRGYQKMLDTIGRPITATPMINRGSTAWNLSKHSAFIRAQREHLWMLLEGILTRPKTSIMPRRLINAVLFALGRLGDSRGLLEFYEARIKLEQSRESINGSYGDVEDNDGNATRHLEQQKSVENSMMDLPSSAADRFAIRSIHTKMDITLFNLFMDAMSSPPSPLHPSPKQLSFSDPSPLELFNKLPTHIEPNQETIEHLFSSIRTPENFKKFGVQFFNALVMKSTRRPVNITREELESVILEATGRIFDDENKGNNESGAVNGSISNNENLRNMIIRRIVHEIANVYEEKDVTECITVFERWEIKEDI